MISSLKADLSPDMLQPRALSSGLSRHSNCAYHRSDTRPRRVALSSQLHCPRPSTALHHSRDPVQQQQQQSRGIRHIAAAAAQPGQEEYEEFEEYEEDGGFEQDVPADEPVDEYVEPPLDGEQQSNSS